MRCFLSHNKADKAVARSIGAHMMLMGLDVWFDEWEIQAGDSIPGKLNAGLAAFDAFVLLWSSNAERSDWVREELGSAIMRAVGNGSVRVIPCLLDKTPLPPLIAHRRAVDFQKPKDALEELLGDLTGKRTRRLRLLAIQAALEDLDVNWTTHPQVIPLVCCPGCGEEDKLEAWSQLDQARDDLYEGIRCTACGWSGGGEV